MTSKAISTILFGFTLVTMAGHAYADSCDGTRAGAFAAMQGTVDAKEAEMRRAIASLASQNTDVARQLIAELNQAIATLEAKKVAASNGAGEEAFLQCKDGQKPAQTAIDLGVVYATSGLALLLPPKMWHVDVGDVLKNPMGGDCSFVRNPLQHDCH